MADPTTITKALAAQADQSANYNTPLGAEQKLAYALWAASLPQQLQSTADYDLQGAWKGNARAAANGHLPDTYKKPNHPTFSAESDYSGPYAQGGAWVAPTDPRQAEAGRGYTFFASPDNLRFRSPEELQAYFRAAEPGNQVVLPQNGWRP